MQQGERGGEGGRAGALLKGSRLWIEWELCVYVRLRGEAGGCISGGGRLGGLQGWGVRGGGPSIGSMQRLKQL